MKESLANNGTKKDKPYIFYGWIILLVSFLTLTLIYGTRYSFSVFFLALLDEFGWDRASTAAIFSVNMLAYGLIAPLVGGLTDRFGPRRIITLGCLLVVIGALISSQAGQAWHLYLSFGVLMGLGVSFAGYPPHVPLLSRWFTHHRATILGIGLAGIGISYLSAPVMQYLISVAGWRNAYAILALIVLLVAVPAVLLFQRTRQDEPVITKTAASASGSPNTTLIREWTLRRAMKTPHLWLIFCSSFFSTGVGLGIVLAHQVRYAVDVGYSSTLAAMVFGLWGIAYAAGLMSGFLADLIDRKKIYALSCAAILIAMVMLIWAGDGISPWKLYLYAVLLGYGVGLSTPTFTAITADLFAGSNFGSINAFANSLSFGLGGAIGPWLAGLIFDLTHSYLVAFVITMLAWFTAAFCIWLASSIQSPLIRHIKQNADE